MSHWYDKDGNPCYTQEKLDGSGERPTTLRDARKYGLVPSVTTIFEVMAKPGLERWKTEQVLKYAFKKPTKYRDVLTQELFDYDYNEWKKEVLVESKEEGKKAADKGTKIHDALDIYYTTGEIKRGYKKYIEAVEKELEQFGATKCNSWVSEASFYHAGGFGGKVDLHHKDLKGAVIDFKTKPTIDKAAVYDEHAMQLAAYTRGLCIPDADCYNLFISYEEEDKKVKTKLIKHKKENIERGWDMFCCLVNLWQLQKRYVPE